MSSKKTELQGKGLEVGTNLFYWKDQKMIMSQIKYEDMRLGTVGTS